MIEGERYGPLVHRRVHQGAIVWLVGAVQFVAAMVVTQLAWTTPYSLSHNYISDLGNTACGLYAARYVCSPWHVVFDVSVALLGVLTILGVLLLPTAFPTRRSRTVGLGLFVVSGVGAVGVGLSPENVNLTVHSLSALLAFAGGSLALIVLGFAMLRDTRWAGYRAYSVLSGLVSLVAILLLGAGAYGWGGFWSDWGAGGIERTILAPILLWTVVVAVHLLRIPTFAPRLFATRPPRN